MIPSSDPFAQGDDLFDSEVEGYIEEENEDNDSLDKTSNIKIRDVFKVS